MPVDVHQALRATLGLVGHALRRGEIELEVDLPEDLPRVRCAPGGLHQVLLNLLKNSSDALEARGGTIRVAARLDGAHVRVEVVDDGPGLDPAVRERLFEPFVTTKAAGKGTGLGLSVSRRILTSCGGTLEVFDREPRGVVARVRLPVEGRDAS